MQYFKTLGGTVFRERINVIFRVFWGLLPDSTCMCTEQRRARKELYEGLGGNLFDGLPPVP